MHPLTHLPSPVLLLLLLKGRLSSTFTSHSRSYLSYSYPYPYAHFKEQHKRTTKQFPSSIPHATTALNSNRSTTTTTSTGEMPRTTTQDNEELIFGKFKIAPSQIFYRSPTDLSAAIVNLRPIVPGHVLIIPKRILPKISQLNTDEYVDLWNTVRIVQAMLEKHYDAKGFNIAIQDGKAAGQSVPHVHVHILPRIEGDFERNDDVYDELEQWAPTDNLMEEKLKEKEKNGGLDVPDDEDRKDRTMQDMEDECVIYRNLLQDSP